MPERPALYRLERTETGYRFILYSYRGEGPESAPPREREQAGGQERVRVRVKRSAGGEVQGRGTQDMSRMASRNPRGEFRETRAVRRATVRRRQR